MYFKHIRAGALGLFGALIGFSFALATSQNAAPRGLDGSAPRAVGSGLTFSNPFLLPGQDANFPTGGDTAADPKGYDLGDACLGSQFVRYLTALDGVQPYTFASSNLNSSNLSLGPAGRLTGFVSATDATPGQFTATLTDAAAVTRTGFFHVFASVCPPGTFRFAHDRLSNARVGEDYITNIEVLGGDASVKFSAVPGSVTFNGSTVTDMETLGIRLFDDGTIAGRPLKSGVLSFTARAQKSAGPLANNRANTTPDQPLSITIAALDSVQSVLGTVSAVMRGNLNRPGHDTFVYNAFFNSNGYRFIDFENAPFTLRVAGKTFTTTLNRFGQSARGGDLHVAISGAPDGYISVRLRNQDLGSLFTTAALTDRTSRVTTVQIQIGDKFLGTEPVDFAVRNRNGHFTMNYVLGRQRQAGGLFQIYAILGRDDFGGTAFRTKFLLSQVPDTQGETFGTASNAVVNIGPSFTENLPLFRGQGFFPPPGVASAFIRGDQKYGILTTYALPQSETGIALSRDAGGEPQTFLLGMKIVTDRLTFNGVTARKIFPFRFFF